MNKETYKKIKIIFKEKKFNKKIMFKKTNHFLK